MFTAPRWLAATIAAVALVATVVTVRADSSEPVQPNEVIETPAVRLINFVDTPATVQYRASGEARVQLESSSGTVDITRFRRVTVRIGRTAATSFMVHMGKISNATLAVGYVRQTNTINEYSFDVIGPEMTLLLRGGPPNTTEQVQLWVYLRS